jgi:hypothetical protein
MTNAAAKLSAVDVQAIFDRSPFIGWLGLKVVSVDHELQEITIRMAMRSELERRPGTGQFHGGPIAAFIDIAGDFAIGMLVGGGVPIFGPTICARRSAKRSPLSLACGAREGRPQLLTSRFSTMARNWLRLVAEPIRARRAKRTDSKVIGRGIKTGPERAPFKSVSEVLRIT